MKSKELKRKEAIERQAEYNNLSTQQKINKLGKTGSERQRYKLEIKLIDESVR